jgi:hypothetical protein
LSCEWKDNTVDFEAHPTDGARMLSTIKQWQFLGAAATMLRLDDPGDNQTCAWLLVQIGGVESLKRVTLGAADSAGSGFRTLRVTN